MIARWCIAVLVATMVLAGCTASPDRDGQTVAPEPSAEAPIALDAAPRPTPTDEAPATPTPTPPTPATPALEVFAGGDILVAPAPLGTFAVARADAGQVWPAGSPTASLLPDRVIPVYDEPTGEPRMLIDDNAIDGVELSHPLLNWSQLGSPLVLRVIAGGADDDWLLVQAPTRPHDRTTWVRRADFDLGHTDRRIEIDISGPGELVLYDGDQMLLRSAIVSGRESRPTPTHHTYLQAGTIGSLTHSPAYGFAQLEMASFSEAMGTFGGGGSPKNYLHGTNQPGLMGQRISSGEIRVPDEVLAELIELVIPGTPITLFDSSTSATLDGVQGRSLLPAATMDPGEWDGSVSHAASRVLPQLWELCADDLICLSPDGQQPDDPFESRYAVARPRDDGRQIPVYDEPGGPRRTVLDINEIDRVRLPNPLFATTIHGEPLVLRVLEERRAEGGWLKVQVPTRPNHSHVWVQADDFELGSTTVRIEVTLSSQLSREADGMWVYRGDEQLLGAAIASGRETRPTPLVNGWVGEIIEGGKLSSAYGSHVIRLGVFSEALGTFGGGHAPSIAIHSTNQPHLIGQRVSSGNIRLTSEALTALVELPDLIGAPISIHDGTQHGPGQRWGTPPTSPAVTTDWLPDAEPLVAVP